MAPEIIAQTAASHSNHFNEIEFLHSTRYAIKLCFVPMAEALSRTVSNAYRRVTSGIRPGQVQSTFQRQLEMHALCLLQGSENAGEVRRRRAPLRAEHTHKAFGRNVRALFKILKPEGRVHVLAQHILP